MINLVHTVAFIVEVVTGLAAFMVPEILVHLLFGVEISGVGIVLTRIAGLSLFALSVSTSPDSLLPSHVPKNLLGLFAYNFSVAIYFGYLAFNGEWVGLLLWPAFAFHVVFACLLRFCMIKDTD